MVSRKLTLLEQKLDDKDSGSAVQGMQEVSRDLTAIRQQLKAQSDDVALIEPPFEVEKFISFRLTIIRLAGVINHRFRPLTGPSITSDLNVDLVGIPGATTANTPTPAGANASTPFAAGAKIDSTETSRLLLNLPLPTLSSRVNSTLKAAIVGNNKQLTILPDVHTDQSRNVNGVTANWLSVFFFNVSANAVFPLTTASFTADGQQITFWVEGWVAA